MKKIIKQINSSFNKRILGSMLFMALGIILYFAPVQQDLTQKQVAIWVIIVSILFLIPEIKNWYFIKTYNPRENFEKKEIGRIAYYLRKKELVYQDNVKEGKFIFDFLLKEFDIYIKYWDKFSKKEIRDKYRKYCSDYEMKLIEIYPDNLIQYNYGSWYQNFDRIFTKRILANLKKR